MAPPPLDYTAVPESFKLPPGANFGGTSGIAFNSKGNIFVLHRGADAADGVRPRRQLHPRLRRRAVRPARTGCASMRRTTSGPPMWPATWSTSSTRPGGWRWCSAFAAGPAKWHEFGHLRLFNEPNEAVIGPTGDLFVLQGHGKADSLVLKFDKDGNFLESSRQEGQRPGEVDLPHSLVFDAQGLLHIADRNNARIQVIDADGKLHPRVQASARLADCSWPSTRPSGSRTVAHRAGRCSSISTAT